MQYYLIWNEHILFFIFEKDAFFVFENGTFLVFENARFSYLKWTPFHIYKWRIFRIWNWHIFLIWKRHISYFKTAHFIFDNKKTLWQSNMGNVNIRNVNIWYVTFRGKRQTAKQVLKFQGFKVSSFQIWGDKVLWELPTLEMSNSEGARTHSKNLRCSF